MSYRVLILLLCVYSRFVIAAQLKYSPARVLKGDTVSFECVLDNTESETNQEIIWYKDGYQIEGLHAGTWNVSASLDLRSKFSCSSKDDGEKSNEVSIDVQAPPAFIKRLVPYQGFLFNIENIYLTCRIECYPLCDIIWKQNNEEVTAIDRINKNVIPADHGTNDFESIESVLTWTTGWSYLDGEAVFPDFTCTSRSAESIGPEVSSTITVAPEYPPRNLKLTSNYVEVSEGEYSPPVKCSGNGRPSLNYVWSNKQTGEIVTKSETLSLGPMTRTSAGTYTCSASNKHGNESTDVLFYLHYRPICKIEFGQLSDRLSLVCSADAQPEVFDYNWEMISPVDTGEVYHQNIVQKNQTSFLLFNPSLDIFRTFKCTARNNIGVSIPCEQVIPGKLPKVVLTSPQLLVVVGMDVAFTCDVFVKPKDFVMPTWSNGSNSMTQDYVKETLYSIISNDTDLVKTTLAFTTTRWHHDTNVKCSAQTNSMEKYNVPPVSAAIRLSILYPPIVTVSPHKIVVQEEGTAILTCTYDANPGILTTAFWYKNNEILPLIEGKHEGGDLLSPSLIIKHLNSNDSGIYQCNLGNSIGTTKSEGAVIVDVIYPPSVKLLIKTSHSAELFEPSNATLTCSVISGNPRSLDVVYWFFNKITFANQYSCAKFQDNCVANPGILELKAITETSIGNYTCQGQNEAGFGNVSQPKRISTYIQAVPKMSYFPKPAIKNKNLSIECKVENTEDASFDWYQGGYLLPNVIASTLTIDHASLSSRTTFSCVGKKDEISTKRADIFVDVEAPPTFIYPLPTYQQAFLSDNNITLTCTIECNPLCSINWLDNGSLIKFEENNATYQRFDKVLPPDQLKNLFESVESRLVITIDKQITKRLFDNAFLELSCSSSTDKNVISTAVLEFDYAPLNLTVSNTVINVVEGSSPDFATCSGLGHPDLTYEWTRKDTKELILAGKTLILGAVTRKEAGYYTCEAYNRRGIVRVDVYVNVLYSPQCTIDYEEVGNSSILICKPIGNPKQFTFDWTVTLPNQNSTSDNETTEELTFSNEEEQSFFLLDYSKSLQKTYTCLVRNSVDEGSCSIVLPIFKNQTKKSSALSYLFNASLGKHWLPADT